MRIILVREGDGRLVGIAPFYLSTNPWFKLRARRMGLLADTHTGSDYLGPLVQSGYEQRAGRVIAENTPDKEQRLAQMLAIEEGGTMPAAHTRQIRWIGQRKPASRKA